jgi:SAM-dependent methyltransferase
LSTGLFSSKAEKYHLYRWDYAPGAIETIYTTAHLSHESTIIDIGAGPGSLAKHFIDRVGRVYLVEPDDEMRRFAQQALGAHPACRIVNACAEATGLPDGCADLVAVAQALHWFEPEAARAEFVRLLKPGGWLAVLRNYGTDERLNAAIEEVYTQENGCDPSIITHRPAWKPMSFYFGGDGFHRLTFPFVEINTHQQFIGGLATASYAPDETNPLYPRFEAAAGEVFDRFSRAGMLHNQAETELTLGQVKW